MIIKCFYAYHLQIVCDINAESQKGTYVLCNLSLSLTHTFTNALCIYIQFQRSSQKCQNQPKTLVTPRAHMKRLKIVLHSKTQHHHCQQQQLVLFELNENIFYRKSKTLLLLFISSLAYVQTNFHNTCAVRIMYNGVIFSLQNITISMFILIQYVAGV